MLKNRTLGLILVLITVFIGLAGVRADEIPLAEDNEDKVEKDPQEQVWTEFVEKFNTEEFIESLEELGIKNSKIVSTENSLKATLSVDGQTYTTNFKYEDGIITYVVGSNEYIMFIDKIWIERCLDTIVTLKSYDNTKLKNWLDNNYKKLNIQNDGIEYSMEDIVYNEKNSLIESGKAYTIFTSFKIDLKNGIKTYSNVDLKDNVVANPDTGVSNSLIVVVLIALLVIGLITYIRIKKYSKFPQV